MYRTTSSPTLPSRRLDRLHRLMRRGIVVSIYGLSACLARGQVTSSNTTGPSSVSAPEQAVSAAAKDAAQNPVAAAISIPLQNNVDYGVGPYRRAGDAFLLEPVIPFKLSSKWAVISRTIVPVEVVPRLSPSEGVDYGLGNIQPQFYLTPLRQGNFLWGAGPQLWLPTATDKVLGTNKWGGGPTMVALYRRGHWLGGGLVNNQFAGINHHHVNQLTIQPFVYYNMAKGWYGVSSTVITADWTASRSQRWTVPLGGGIGRVFLIGKQPFNARTQIFNDVRTTNGGPSWQLQTQLQILLVHKK
ncbi:neuromedin U [Terriglobus sp. ADX1]|uniref:neuromedin U n=1 Tax=Terriglobus sp. ADX1 TaxID=2794063 RepID=UPI002FE5BAAF